MGSNISIYLDDDLLKQLDDVLRQEADSNSSGSNRKLSRSKIIEKFIREGLSKENKIDLSTIEYQVVSLAKEYGAKKVSLFGSYARGEATENSDVDLLLEKGDIRGLKVLDFQMELSDRLGKQVDVVTTEGASKRFLSRIKPDEVVLYDAG